MQKILIKTAKKDEVIDLTEKVEKKLKFISFVNGICVIFVAHTSCSLSTVDLDPGTDLDLLDTLRKMLPVIYYRHPHDPSHTPDHLLSSIIGPSVIVPFKNKKLLLGTFQRIILIELNGPRERIIYLSSLKTS